MRFADIKKFWEGRLGGQSSRSSQTAESAESDRKDNQYSGKKPASFSGSKSIIEKGGTKEPSPGRVDSNQTISGDSSLSGVLKVLKNEQKQENEAEAIATNDAVDDSQFDCSQIKQADDKRIEHQLLYSCTDGGAAIEKSTRKEQKTSLSANNSPRKSWFFKKNKFSVKNETQLDGHKSKPNQNPIDSSSAPASVNSSPRKIMNESSRYHSRSNDKFNEVQSFWVKWEKQLVAKSVTEKRYVFPNCIAFNYFKYSSTTRNSVGS